VHTRRATLAVLFALSSAGLTLSSADDEPEVFTSKEWKFKAKFPSKPKESSQKVAGVALTAYAVEGKDGAYVVGVADLPIPAGETDKMIQDRLDGARDGAVKNVGGKLQDSKAITLDKKYPGREVSATIAQPKEGILRARVYLVGSRLYQVLVIGTKEHATSKEADAFLESFKVIE